MKWGIKRRKNVRVKRSSAFTFVLRLPHLMTAVCTRCHRFCFHLFNMQRIDLPKMVPQRKLCKASYNGAPIGGLSCSQRCTEVNAYACQIYCFAVAAMHASNVHGLACLCYGVLCCRARKGAMQSTSQTLLLLLGAKIVAALPSQLLLGDLTLQTAHATNSDFVS